MKVLIYGGTGYIGSKLIEYLMSLNYEVGNVSRRDSLFGNVNNYSFNDNVETILSTFKPDKIIYMSACFDNKNVSNIIDVNIKKPLEILTELENHYGIEFIYIGSYWQFGNAGDPNVPIDLYSASKSAMVPFLDYYNTYTNVSCKEIVLYGTYGESDGRGKLLDYLISMSNAHQKVELTEGYQELNLVSVNKICIHIGNVLPLKAGNKFQILSNVVYTPRDLVCFIQKHQSLDVEFGKVKYRAVELMNIHKPSDYIKILVDDELESYIKDKLRRIV